jgi:hypothetical protein
MATTNHIGVTLVEQSQSQKEVTVNEALTRIDALLNSGVISRTTNTPPVSPTSGDLYIVGASPTGAWSGQAAKLAYYDQIWRFITPKNGSAFWVNDEAKSYVYDTSTWVPAISNDLAALEALTTNGIAVRTATNNWVTRSITAGVGISVANGSGVGGDPIITFIAGFSNMSDSGISSPANGETLVYSGGLWRNTKGHTTLFYNTQSGASYTLVSTDAGRTLYLTSASAVTLTLPNNFTVGYNCRVIQAAAGQVTFTPASGANRRNRQSHTKSAGQWAVCWLEVVSNSGGSAAEYVLSGDTAL